MGENKQALAIYLSIEEFANMVKTLKDVEEVLDGIAVPEFSKEFRAFAQMLIGKTVPGPVLNYELVRGKSSNDG